MTTNVLSVKLADASTIGEIKQVLGQIDKALFTKGASNIDKATAGYLRAKAHEKLAHMGEPQETTPVTLYERHELSKAGGDMKEADFAKLVSDIEKHGQRSRGVLYEGLVLDGWHRYEACMNLRISFEATTFTGSEDDARSYAESMIEHRKHLTPGQRTATLFKINGWRPMGNLEQKQKDSNSATVAELPSTTAEVARKAKTSVRTAERTAKGMKAGLEKPLLDGDITPGQAEKIADLPEQSRAAAVEVIKAGGSLATALDQPDKKPSAVKTTKPKGEKSLAAANARIVELTEEVAQLKATIDVSKDTIKDLATQLEDFTAIRDGEEAKVIVGLRGAVTTLRSTSDGYQEQNAQLKREVASLRRKLGK